MASGEPYCPRCLLGLGMASVASTKGPVERMGSAKVSDVQGAQAQLERETTILLRELLKAGCTMAILVLGGFLVREIMFSTLSAVPYSAQWRVALIVTNSASTMSGTE